MTPSAPAQAAPSPPPFLRRLVTPEGLDLRLTLASAGERASAFLLDGVIMIAALVALSVGTFAAFIYAKEDGREALGILWLLGFFLLRNGYFVLFELGWRAATPGKRALGLRVVARDGGRLTTEAILVRNALREIEFFLPVTLLAISAFAGESVAGVAVALALAWSGVFALFPFFNRDRLRVGDFVAGTWVVRAPRARLLADLAEDSARGLPRFVFTSAQTGAYGVKELAILEEVLRRKDAGAMKAVADRIRIKIDFSLPPGETDSAFLAAYYAALRGRLEHGLLFGRRRKDKFDDASNA